MSFMFRDGLRGVFVLSKWPRPGPRSTPPKVCRCLYEFLILRLVKVLIDDGSAWPGSQVLGAESSTRFGWCASDPTGRWWYLFVKNDAVKIFDRRARDKRDDQSFDCAANASADARSAWGARVTVVGVRW